jgi:hypothetical protein
MIRAAAPDAGELSAEDTSRVLRLRVWERFCALSVHVGERELWDAVRTNRPEEISALNRYRIGFVPFGSQQLLEAHLAKFAGSLTRVTDRGASAPRGRGTQ